MRLHTLAATGTVLAAVVAGVPAGASASVTHPVPGAPPATRFAQINLIADREGAAPLVDPSLVNPWGLALSATSPLWVPNEGTSVATIYAGGVGGATPTKAALTVAVAGGPTGQVFNDTTDFVVTGPAGGSGAARFIFATSGGDIAAWNPAAAATNAVVTAHVDGAAYTGLALAHTDAGPFLLAANLAGGRIDVFDATFHRVPLPSAFFRDPRLPADYAPFNVAVINDQVYVAYAKRGADGEEEAGPGLGIVDRFTDFGLTPHRVASHGTLNAPWALAIAPDTFGRFAGALLVGNFGDGRIGAYAANGRFLGLLRSADGQPIAIDGLWALLPGSANTGGVGSLWFSAGPEDEQHGLIGQLAPVS